MSYYHKTSGFTEMSVGQRIAYYRIMKGLSQTDLAYKLRVSQQLIAKWENDKVQTYTGHLDALCNILDVDKSMLLVGVSSENQTVYQDLGLTDAAIEELKREKELSAKEYSAEISIFESFANTADAEGYSPAENLFMINQLLSNGQGLRLLSLLYRYCVTDFDKAFSDGKEIYDLEFNNASGIEGKTVITTSLLRFATLRAVEQCVEDLREIIIEEGKNNGKETGKR